MISSLCGRGGLSRQRLASRLNVRFREKQTFPFYFSKKILEKALCFCSGVKEGVNAIFIETKVAPPPGLESWVPSRSINYLQSVQKSLNLLADSSVYLTVC